MPNQYVNKVVQSNGTTLIDISDTTAVASDVAQGKYFYLATGEKIEGTSSGSGTPAISVVDTVDSNGGTVRTITALDISDTTAVASDVASGKYFYTAGGVKTAGTANGGTPSTTSHEIHLEFSDGTDTDIEVDYDDTWVGTLITSTKPTIYGVKTIDSAALDNVTWYERLIIPLNTELVDYTTVSSDTAIGSDGEAFTQEWSYASDYIPVDPSMTFSYTNYYWFYIGVYDENKNVLRAIYAMNDSTVDPNDGNTGHGTLSGNELSGASYIRLCGSGASSSYMSLIRTA